MSEIRMGYLPGLLGWTVAEHGRCYAEHWDFGPFFESKVASEMANFVGRMERPGNHIWSVGDPQGFVATLTLDGDDARGGLTHLRWFITNARAQGQGLGKRLMQTALAQAKADHSKGVYLTTFAGLDAARRIYDSSGFTMVQERRDRTWGTEVLEQRFEVIF